MLPGVFLACLAGAATGSTETWVRARSPRAEVLSNGSEAQARRAADHLETFHRVLQAALAPLAAVAEGAPPPLVIAFRDRASFSRFLPLRDGEPQEVEGVILGGDDRPYIAVNLEAHDFERTLGHEYTHFALNPLLAAQPPWLGEGLAELLSGASVWPGSVTVGGASDVHLRRIAREGPLPLRALLAVGYLSPTYQGEAGPGPGTSDRRLLLYAQSWALAHWIVAGGHGGMPALLAYAESIAEGEDPPSAFGRSFGITVDAAQASLAGYLAALPLPTIAFPLAAEAGAGPPSAISAVDAAEMEVHLGHLLFRGGRYADARSHFSRALEAGNSSAHEGMAAVLLRDGRLEDAKLHIEAALAADPADARALQRRAEHIVREFELRGEVLSAAEQSRAVAILERALAANPDLADAADLLAHLQPTPLAHRIVLLRRAVRRQPERAELAFTLSGLHIRRNDFAEAARVLRRAGEGTRNEAHRFLSRHLLGKIAAIASAEGEARGTLEAVECLARGALAFRVRTSSMLLHLSAASPQSLFVYDAEGETVEREFTCGPAARPVTVRYLPGPPGATTHRLLSLSFAAAR